MAFYRLTTSPFLAVPVIFWKPLPLALSPGLHALALAGGTLTYFPGLACLLWGRLTLGMMCFVSTAFGALLFADHQLVTGGPVATVGHPIYLGLIAAAAGSLLLYQTWTTAAFAVFAPFVFFRARREEQALAAEFGEEWREYSTRTGFLVPFLRRAPHDSAKRTSTPVRNTNTRITGPGTPSD